MNKYWSQYWQQGYLTSFGKDIKNNYNGEIKNTWSQFFSTISDHDSVLDIGTGNGALLALALNEKKTNCKYFGIDYAQLNITNKLLTSNSNVELLQNVSAEDLPFEEDFFTHIISQFALEYTNIEKSIKEIARVIKPSGSFKFICHHQESTIVLPNKVILQLSLKIKQKNGVLSTLNKLTDALASKETNNPAAEILRKKLNKQLNELSKIGNDAFLSTNILLLIKTIFSKKHNLNDNEVIKQYKNELQGSIHRLNDLVTVALSEREKDNLINVCRANNLIVSKQDILMSDENEVLGYNILGYYCGDS